MTCERYRELLWSMLDGESLPRPSPSSMGERGEDLPAGEDIKRHAAACPGCRAYAAQAMRLERMMPRVLEVEEPGRSALPSVLAAVREEGRKTEPPRTWIPAGAALAAALCWSVWRWADLGPAREYLPLPGPEMLPSSSQLLGPVEGLLSGAAGAEPFLVAATCVLAAALWISTQWSLLQRAGRRNHG